tara:strand:+ start:1404 stop:1715 length:312 start_codon:yes stop_codon:yes gene_type:complete
MFSEADVDHLKWLRLKAFQARERLEAAEKFNRGPQAEALLDLIDALGDACVRTVWGIVQQKYRFGDDTVVSREVKAMSKDIVDVAWEVEEAVEVINEFVMGEK